jgi:hypothetical protein
MTQGRDSLAHRQVEPFDKGGLDSSRLSTGAQGRRKLVKRAEQGAAFDANKASAPVMFDKLSVEKPGVDLPVASLPPRVLNPATEVGGQRVEVQLHAFGASLVNMGRQSGANTFTSACTTAWAIGCVRGPTFSPGITLVRAPRANQTQRASMSQRVLVQSSSSWTCRSFRFWKSRSCSEVACRPARVS